MAGVSISNSGLNFEFRGAFMTAARWKNLIKQQLKALGNENKAYDPVVSTLADILDQRDKVYSSYIEDGEHPVCEYTNKGGATNMTKNPLLILWDDLNKSALAYWRELGLTPSGYKKMTGASPKKEKTSGLAEALQSLES